MLNRQDNGPETVSRKPLQVKEVLVCKYGHFERCPLSMVSFFGFLVIPFEILNQNDFKWA